MSEGREKIGAPEHLSLAHDVAAFDSGVPALDDWLNKRALVNDGSGASRTYVVGSGGRVVGYYALAHGAVAQQQAKRFYERCGFAVSPVDPMTLMISIADAEKLLSRK